jgi:alkanesulfonate monooxygenase SsuD/methylene tetrahydromethanopterin reductase-like flavin-dependent oxidoreductase (luciferase family)
MIRMDAVKAGVGIDPRLGLTREQQRVLVRDAARLGFDSLWTPAGLTGRSIFQILRDWWDASGGLEVGTSVIPFPGWTPVTLASESASLNEVVQGKFKLGIGLGGYPSAAFREQLGLPDVPTLRYTREYMTTLRCLLAGETVRGVKLTIAAPRVPVYLAAMGAQMLRLAGELADGVTPNWASAAQIAWMRPVVAEGAEKVGRKAEEVPFAHYIRVCIDEDAEAARRAFAGNMLGYAMARPGQPKDSGYRGHFARMGFDPVLNQLEAKRDAGVAARDLVDEVPAELMRTVGYFGKPEGAAEAFKALAAGLDEAMVRLITVRSGDLEACQRAIRALEPSTWR